MKVRLPLMKDLLTPLAKSVFISLGLTTATSPTAAAIKNKFFGLA